jgi:hypothetical protein
MSWLAHWEITVTESPEQEKAEIFRLQARKLFGLLLNLLCNEAQISQSELGRRSTAYRRYLVSKRYIYSESDTGSVGQSGISRVIRAESVPCYSQVYIWLTLLMEIFNSDDYKQMCARSGKEVYVFTKEHWFDMWRLACFGTPEEVIAAYHRHKWLLRQS